MPRILFIHQNFPAQFVHVVTELVRRGWEVAALTSRKISVAGVKITRYEPQPLPKTTLIPELRDLETKAVRATMCAKAMQGMSAQGFKPDIIVAHPGWGEALFCKDIWPDARLVIYAEFFYGATGSDVGFDPEFYVDSLADRMRLRMKNTVHLHAFQAADLIYSPTQWQRSQLPLEYQSKAHVAFDGINTAIVKPHHGVSLALQRDKITLTKHDEIITFVNRNLEPYRGFHIFMRALPEILAARPNARCLIVGQDGVSYGKAPKGGDTWREAMLREVGSKLPMNRIHFLGALAYRDYLKVLQLSTCHVYLTYPFVLSWSCLEAMSAQCLVVGSNTAPVREVIEHGVNGLLVDFFDTKALADQVIEVLSNPSPYLQMRHNARQTVVSRYDLATICLPSQLQLICEGSKEPN